MEELYKLLSELENKISDAEKEALNVSKTSVGWHVEHSFLVINQVVNQLEKSNAKNFKGSFNLTKTVLFFFNKFPRGKARAPKVVTPKGNVDVATLKERLELGKKNVEKLKNLDKGSFFEHPYFGNIKLEETVKFLKIHTKHHLDIINDIIKQSK